MDSRKIMGSNNLSAGGDEGDRRSEGHNEGLGIFSQNMTRLYA
jgi:hypothetical protein